MALLKREAIFGAVDIKTQDVDMPEWGGSVRVRQMTVAERNEFASRAKEDPDARLGAWLVATLCVDESGASLFKPEDVEEIKKKNFHNIDLLAREIVKLNALGEPEVDAAEKN